MPHELGAGREAELLHHVRAMGLRRADGDEEELRDLMVRVAERKQPQNLAFTLRQRISVRARPRLGLRGSKPRAEGRMDILSAAGDLPHCLDELVVRRLLEEVAAR